MKSIVILCCGAAFGVGLAWAGAAEGKAVYAAKCQTCHEENGAPKQALAKMLKVNMLHLGSKAVQGQTDAQLKDIVVKGKGKMKGVAGLTPQQQDDVVAYMRTLKEK
jgi:mono/diheme cytochrome c family protein